jgi:hypothetical protein
MKTSLIIEEIIYAVVIVLLLAIFFLVFVSPPGFLDANSVYQVF